MLSIEQILNDAKKISEYNKVQSEQLEGLRLRLENDHKLSIELEFEYFDVRFKDKSIRSFKVFNYNSDLDGDDNECEIENAKYGNIIEMAGQSLQQAYDKYWDDFDKFMNSLGWCSDDEDEDWTSWTKEKTIMRIINLNDDYPAYQIKVGDKWEDMDTLKANGGMVGCC